MKKALTLLLVCLASCQVVISQTIPPAPADKAVVYFCRTSSLGAAINFTLFDSATVISKQNGAYYVRYECAPGYHLFWGRSENKDYVEANVEPDKIYFIEVVPEMGMIKASIRLNPVDPGSEAKPMKRILKQLGKKDPEPVMTTEEQQTGNFEDIIKRGLKSYNEAKANGDPISRLESTMNYKME